MSLFMSLDCPYCATAKAPFKVCAIGSNLNTGEAHRAKRQGRVDAAGICSLCNRMIVAEVDFTASLHPTTDRATGDLASAFQVAGETYRSTVLQHSPKPASPVAPEHLPDRLLRPFLEAEKAFSIGLWNSAVAGYGKTVDRAITPLIGAEAEGKMLGPKIGMLERSKVLPPAMLDWIRAVKDDRNFALHHSDMDFSSRDEVLPARDFAFTLLTYLYTLPKKVRIARGLPNEPDIPVTVI